MPAEALDAYKATEPWSKFGTIGTIEGGTPEPTTEKCATPTIQFVDGELVFECDTEGVEFVYEVVNDDVKKGTDSRVKLACTYEVSVYAKKDGFENSEMATYKIEWLNMVSDVNYDGVTNAADIVMIVKKIMGTK